MGRPDERCGKFGFLWLVQDEGEDVCLALTGGDEGNAGSVIKDGKGKGDALWRWLGRVLEIGHPCATFLEEFVVWEKGTGVSV